ncbi:MAG: hypothetical protein ABGX04_10015 [Myxococcales bacterium]
MSETRLSLTTALRCQLFYAALVILWQISGKVLVALELPSPGPSPSLTIAGIAFLVAGAMVLTANRVPVIFALLALLSGYAAASTIQNAFVADPSLWPSDLARYAGVAINLVGVAATAFSMTALAVRFRGRAATPD